MIVKISVNYIRDCMKKLVMRSHDSMDDTFANLDYRESPFREKRCPITGILSATVKNCILFRIVYFSMFLLETRFYGI